jgi:hypothetical protein
MDTQTKKKIEDSIKSESKQLFIAGNIYSEKELVSYANEISDDFIVIGKPGINGTTLEKVIGIVGEVTYE